MKNVCPDSRWGPDVLRNEKRLWQDTSSQWKFKVLHMEAILRHLSYFGISVYWETEMNLSSYQSVIHFFLQAFDWIKDSDDNIFNPWLLTIINTLGVLLKLHLLHITSLKMQVTSFSKSGTALPCFPSRTCFVDKSGFWVFMLTPVRSILHTGLDSQEGKYWIMICVYLSALFGMQMVSRSSENII